jgi:hypothetical protein
LRLRPLNGIRSATVFTAGGSAAVIRAPISAGLPPNFSMAFAARPCCSPIRPSSTWVVSIRSLPTPQADLSAREHPSRPLGEPADTGLGIIAGGVELLGYEAFLRGRLRKPHTGADFGPRRSGPPCLVDEMTDQMVSPPRPDPTRTASPQLLQGMVGMLSLHGVDQIVESNRYLYSSTVG